MSRPPRNFLLWIAWKVVAFLANKEKVQNAVEEIRGRFGKAAVTYASLLGDLKMPTDGRDKVKMPGLMYQ